MRSKITWMLPLFVVLALQFSYGQGKTITGNVTDQDGLPLPGANVTVKGTTNGTQTDFDGNYSISTSTGQILVFSYVGQKTIEKTVSSSNTIDVVLEQDSQALEEVIVLGYSRKEAYEVTGSSVQVSGEDVAAIQLPSIEQALQGKVAGVQISNASGTPGSVQDIRIRGVGSINASNQPLFVIDGVPVINDDLTGSENVSTFNPLSSINSQDIASMTVLKDASATAAYGARGSNGVIVITTKSGSKNGKTAFTFTSNVGFQNDAYNKRDILNGADRLLLLNESLVNSYSEFGFTPDNAIQQGVDNELISPATLDYDGTDYRWSELLSRENAIMQNYNFSASGGDEINTFYASIGYNKTNGTVVGADFERINGVFRFNRKLTDNVDFTTSMNVSNTVQNPILEGGSFFSNPFITRVLMNPFNNPYNNDGSYNTDLQFGSLPNVLYVLENNIARNELTRAISNSNVDWKFTDNLTFSTRFGMDLALLDYKSYTNRVEGDADSTGGDVTVSNEKNYNFVLQNSLNYRFKLGGKHNFDVTGLFEYQKNQNSFLQGFGENFPADGLTNLESAGSNFDADSNFKDWYNVSYLGLLSYNFDGRYVFDGTFRREGSSRFAAGGRYGNFGSVGVAWNIHREEFMRDGVFNELKVRGSYGITGNNAIDENEYQALLSYSEDYAGAGAAYPSQFGNQMLTWEKGATYDVGLDFGLYNNRVSGSFAYYNRRTYDLLQDVPLSFTSGFASQQQNVGEMVNKGIEVQLNVDIIRTENFMWNISGNIGTVDNEVTELAKDANGVDINPSTGSYKTTEVGLPIGSWYMRTWAGVNPDTGAPEWYVNGEDGATTSNYNEAERVYQGAPIPKYTAGLSTKVEYKGFFLNVDLYAAGGHKIYEQYAQFYLNTNSFTLGSYNGASELLDRWQQPGDITDVPKLAFGSSDNFQATSSRHLFDGDYIRLRNIAVGYNLPSRYTDRIGLDGLTFTLRGTNVGTWVKDDGLLLDPEVRADGYTRLTTPPTESYTLGVTLKF